MKKMTKEELIEYFIEQLGDNEVLGKVMTIDQIREKLNTLIKDIKYVSQPGKFYACWESHKKCLIIDLNKINNTSENEAKVIVHEFIHILSSSYLTYQGNNDIEYKNNKIGIEYMFYRELEDGTMYGEKINGALTEGITDLLAERITGLRNSGYKESKEIFKLLSIIINEDVMLEKFFTDIKPEEMGEHSNGRSIFRSDIVQKYGVEFGKELNIGVEKVLRLSDELKDLNTEDNIYGLSEYGKRIRDNTKKEIFDTLYLIFEKIIENEPDIMKKIDIMMGLEKICDFRDTDLKEIRKMVSIKVLYELLNDDSMEYTKKIDIIKKIEEQKIYFPGETLDDVFLKLEGATKLSIEEKTELYIQLQKGQKLTTERFDIIYDMYVKSGKIIEENFLKKELLKIALGVPNSGSFISKKERMNERVYDCFYYKVGDYYAVSENNYQSNTFLFDLDGKCLETRKLAFNVNNQTTDHYYDNKSLSRKFGEDIIQTIYEQLKEKFEEYEEYKAKSNGEYFDSSVTVIGKILRINYEYYFEEDEDEIDMCYVDFYSVNDDGTLELIPKRRRKKNCR